ncbi:MAG TPA: polyphosphate kinase 2 [Rhizomicrobium sp.]|nr:polyphosphate kinase 2 [Rhizomicrobium sp.]
MAKTAEQPDRDKHYRRALYDLQVELVKLQHKLIAEGRRVLVIIEGRDGAGKDGAIKRLTEHMSPRETRVHAPGKPSSREETEWYFQRFVPFLPAAAEFVVFNRSWYNRAGVEPVMGFCTKEQVEQFFESVVPFEAMLVRDGIALRKYYLDISRKEQKERLAAREKDPLKQWKLSPVDAKALKNWKAYSAARDEMFRRSSHVLAPWRIARADVKKLARLELIRDLLSSFDYDRKSKKLARPDPSVVFPWSEDAAGRIAT